MQQTMYMPDTLAVRHERSYSTLSLISTGIGDHLRAYTTIRNQANYVNSALYPSRVTKLSTCFNELA